MFDVFQMFTVGKQFETGDGIKWVAVSHVRDRFVLAVRESDPLPAPTYLVKMPDDAEVRGEK